MDFKTQFSGQMKSNDYYVTFESFLTAFFTTREPVLHSILMTRLRLRSTDTISVSFSFKHDSQPMTKVKKSFPRPSDRDILQQNMTNCILENCGLKQSTVNEFMYTRESNAGPFENFDLIASSVHVIQIRGEL